jgi:hypothetical protein
MLSLQTRIEVDASKVQLKSLHAGNQDRAQEWYYYPWCGKFEYYGIDLYWIVRVLVCAYWRICVLPQDEVGPCQGESFGVNMI